MLKKTIYFMLLLANSILLIGCNNTLNPTTTTEQTTTTTTEIITSSETTTTGVLYEVTFNAMGGTAVESLNVPEDGLIDLPTPEKEGYTFDNWYYDENLSVPYTTITMPAHDINLYAKWTINQYTIRYYTILPKLNSEETVLSTFFSEGYSSAITSENRLFTWGDNYKGKLGNGTSANQYSPVEITSRFNLSNEEILTSVSLGEQHSAAITSVGRIFTWGYNYTGQLGDGTTSDKYTPTEITSHFSLISGETFTSLSLGAHHSAALTSEGQLYVWGWNYYGQLGNDTPIDQNIPVNITSFFNLNNDEMITSISLGYYHSSAITSDGRVFTWGYNYKGQLGDGTRINQYTPKDITSQFNLSGGETIVSMSLGEENSSAVTSIGRLFSWGNNIFGKLGDGTQTDKYTPTDITSQFNLNSEETIISVSLSSDHSAAITSEGRLFTWGYNRSGQLGDGTRVDQYTPKDITSQFSLNPDETIMSVSLGRQSSSAVTTTGRAFTWGYNGVGQLGDGTIMNIETPYNLLFVSKLFIASESYNFNVSIDEFVPTREGFTFDGWYIDETLATPYILTTMPAESMTLYAKWITNE